MEKEEILARSRKENRGMDEREAYAIARGSLIACRVGMLLCCLLTVLEVVFTAHISYASWAVFFCLNGTLFLVKFRLLRQKHELGLPVLYYALFGFFFRPLAK